jgi:crotonobetainyl-CoA:carnitine CoA-transferase CaiB-like acyl-CoA transferase
MAASSKRLVQWMDEEGMAPEWLKQVDWAIDYDTAQITQEKVDQLEVPVNEFFLTKTASEISEEAAKRGFMACPTSNAKDIYGDPHLKARDFWENVEHSELGNTLTYCGPFVKLSEAAVKIFRRAPLIGEHNEQVYERELGLSREELTRLRQAEVI